MYFAIDKDGKRISAYNAEKNKEYRCSYCGRNLILRQGSINIAHFAHEKEDCVDDWHYDMSEWHYSMQARFPEAQRERVVEFCGEKHRADILLGNKVIEFQHSPISIDELEERNAFYNNAGYSVAWVFDVQEQYDYGQIEDVDYADALMYKWKNPKRYLKCFPAPKEYEKKLMIYLYWIDDDGYEMFNRVIWSSLDEDDCPDFKRFIVSERGISSKDIESKLNVEEFFETKDDLLKKRLSSLKCRYNIKRCGVKGYPKDTYVCPRYNRFGLQRYGEQGCSYCRYCAAIKRFKKGFSSYCCYPNQVNELFEGHPGYECCDVEEY